ncbi:unnamed protein product [Penicillium salamii]|nr:unnamed protein product [Penicillium salamii]
MHTRLEEAFDKGVFVIIPDIPNEPSIFQMIQWRLSQDHELMHRPAARYLYFHYCMQVLQKAWQSRAQGRPQGATAMLKAENGRFFWGTQGRYLPRNMLLAFVEELAHDYEDLLEGSSRVNSNEKNILLAVAAAQINRVASGTHIDSGLLLGDEEEDEESETSSGEANST